jgi:choline-sulfatase
MQRSLSSPSTPSISPASNVDEAPPPPPVRAETTAATQTDSKGPRLPWLRVPPSIATGARFAAGATLGLWLGDVVLVAVSRGHATPFQRLVGMGAALFVALPPALLLGSLLGPVLVPGVSAAIGNVGAGWRAIRRGGRDAEHALAAGSLTVALVAAVFTWLGYRTVVAIQLGFARPDTMAGALAASYWVFAVALALTVPWTYRALRTFVDKRSETRGLRWLFGWKWAIPALLAAPLAFAVKTFVVNYRDELSAVPWVSAIPLGGLVLGVAGAGHLQRARPRWRRIAVVVTLVAFAFGGVLAMQLRSESTTARTLAFDRSLAGQLGYAVWTAALDFDGDGQLSILGGGDCAPFDPRRHAGAMDVPDNGVDEDCDGEDLKQVALHPRARLNVGQVSLPDKPMIVFVTIDALAATRLVTLGSKTSFMPRLDDFAARSALFTHCFSTGPSTRLSFPSMFTSRWDSQLTFEVGPRLPYSFTPTERELQDVLDDAGYETVAVLPTEYFNRPRWPSITRGFQRVDTSAIPTGKFNSPQVTDAALRVLSEQRDRPLYLWVHYYDAHPPYQIAPGTGHVNYSEEAAYESELRFTDREVGRLLDTLAQRSEPMYTIIAADHGTVFHPDPASRHAHYGYDLYTATLHVPLVVHGPGIKPSRPDGLVTTMDITPTVADILKVDPRAELEGTSLLPEMMAGQKDTQRVLFHEFFLAERIFHGFEPLEIVSLHQGNYNFILNRLKGTYELYDWTTDYYEQRDLYEEQSRSPNVKHLKSLLSSFLQQFGHKDKPGVMPTNDRLFRSEQ